MLWNNTGCFGFLMSFAILNMKELQNRQQFIFMIIIFMIIIMITRSYATLRAEDLDSRASIQFGQVHFASCLRHSVRIRPDLLCHCHCHSSSVICHPSGLTTVWDGCILKGNIIFVLTFLEDSIQEF